MTFRIPAALGILAVLAAAPAGAHVVLDQTEAPANAYVRVALRVGHGCAGGAATTAIRLTVPPELRGARPMPHPGWTLSLPGAAADAHSGHGGHAAHGAPAAPAAAPGEIAWTGGRLDDAMFDEFVLLIRTPAEAGTVIAFPVVQECEGGVVSRWTERPAEGARAASPAPLLRVVAGR
ncbi:YcnI family protein [Roseomonas sp. WA12]